MLTFLKRFLKNVLERNSRSITEVTFLINKIKSTLKSEENSLQAVIPIFLFRLLAFLKQNDLFHLRFILSD